MAAYIKNGKVVIVKEETQTKNVNVVEVKKLDGTAIKLKKSQVEELFQELEGKAPETKELVADHVVVTKFRNDEKQPTLFANAKGEFVSVDNKEDFVKADKAGALKLTVEEAKAIVSVEGFDANDIEISPAFTVEQFVAIA